MHKAYFQERDPSEEFRDLLDSLTPAEVKAMKTVKTAEQKDKCVNDIFESRGYCKHTGLELKRQLRQSMTVLKQKKRRRSQVLYRTHFWERPTHSHVYSCQLFQ